MKSGINESFENIFEQNKRRIHYQIHKLNINDPNQEYFQEGLCAMWNAYETYQPDKGIMATYFNYTIRNRLIDLHRKNKRDKQVGEMIVKEKKQMLHEGNKTYKGKTSYHVSNYSDHDENDPYLWEQMKSLLTENQWKWVYYYILLDMPVKDIAVQENKTVDAVKGWGRQVRKKLGKRMLRESWNCG